MLPSCWATYSRPSGPNCREVGLIELAFLRKLLLKFIGVVVWAHEGSARSRMVTSTTPATSARMYTMLVDTLAPIVLYFVLYFGSGMSLTHTIYYNLCPMYVPCS